ncbi:flagellar assembly protein A [Desulfospira joergensenii]|uniref:flagellar assembly protein A n=1 Tax=Desulfospira joergensenii TaxID=53329 RepID=UPI0003B7B6BB|nr:flagellar assembly protein A [Desulfospira joergensenii]
MSEKKKPRLLILEKDEQIRTHARDILEQAGWDVLCKDVSKEALIELKKSKASPFALFISSYKLPLMEGDDIMQKAKAISPMTQRMLMVPADQTDILISAINKAGIHACITYPFMDTDLVDQARTCLQQFLGSMKRKQLKRVTVHQNKQMFQIAQKLRKKDGLLKNLINEKKAKKRLLQTDLPKGIRTLSARLEQHDIPMTCESFEAEFVRLKDHIRDGFNKAASKAGLDPVKEGSLNIQIESEQEPASDPESHTTGTDGIKKILETAFSSLEKVPEKIAPLSQEEGSGEMDTEDNGTDPIDPANSLEEIVEITISEDQTQAFIKKLKIPDPPSKLTLSSLLDLLREKNVTYGLIGSSRLESWILESLPQDEKIQVAAGTPPDKGQDGSILYHFRTDYTNPGKILEDGSIDFRERGGIPYVSEGDLLAVKTPPREGKTGVTISGNPIPVDEVLDPVFNAEANTTLSEDGLSIYAALDGQPHVDALGSITVNPELVIEGDVDFQTGNIDFKGNINVKGMIKEGFTIKGVNLTAQEIEGSQVDITGDLCISSGITDANISVQGNIHAKFINNSKIACFGDLVIQKEIIDSSIATSGECQNSTGLIIASKIAAKAGIEAGRIGTDTSKPAVIKIGVDEHADMLTREIDKVLETSMARLKDLKENIQSIEEQDQELYGIVSQKAQEQEKANNEIKTLGEAMVEMKKASDISGLSTAKTRIKKLADIVEKAEKELDRIFTLQDGYAKQIENLKQGVERLELANKNMVKKKKRIREFSSETTSLARVTVQKTISQDTIIQGPNASLTLRNDQSRCRIEETLTQEEGQQYYEMNILDL